MRWAIIATGLAGMLLLFGIGNLVGLEWPDGLPVVHLWPVWGQVLATLVLLLLGFFVVGVLGVGLLSSRNGSLRLVFAVLLCALSAAEAGIVGISYQGATIWEGGGIPSLPSWAAIVMTVCGGLLALYGFSEIIVSDTE